MSSEIRECRKRALFEDGDFCEACKTLDECSAQPRLTDDELKEALYDRYLAPFFEPLLAAIGGRG